MVCCSTDLGKEYARKFEKLSSEEELIQEEELEAEALAEIDPQVNKVPHRLKYALSCQILNHELKIT